jgi:hypothetical protein
LHVWYQESSAGNVLKPELLLKTDICEDPSWGFPGEGCVVGESILPPIVDLDKRGIPYFGSEGNARTIIKSGESRQFWVTVHIPQDAQEGTYIGELKIRIGGQLYRTLNIRIDVYGVQIYNPTDYFFGIQFAMEMTNATDEASLRQSEEEFSRYLGNMINHGINSIRVTSASSGLIPSDRRTYEISYQEDLSEPLMEVGPKAVIWENGVAPIVPGRFLAPYFLPPRTGYKLYNIIKQIVNLAEENGYDVPYMQGIDDSEVPYFWGDAETSFTQLQTFISEELGTLAIPNHLTGSTTFTGPPSLPSTNPTGKWYYWQSWENEIESYLNRHLTGYFLLNSGWNGVYPFQYAEPRNPNPEKLHDYFAYAEAAAGFSKGSTGVGKNMVYLALTSPGGKYTYPINTIQWEELREGVYDFRYAYTLSKKLEEARNLALQKYDCNMLARITEMEKEFRTIMDRYNYGAPSPHRLQYHNDRLQILRLLKELEQLMSLNH